MQVLYSLRTIVHGPSGACALRDVLYNLKKPSQPSLPVTRRMTLDLCAMANTFQYFEVYFFLLILYTVKTIEMTSPSIYHFLNNLGRHNAPTKRREGWDRNTVINSIQFRGNTANKCCPIFVLLAATTHTLHTVN